MINIVIPMAGLGSRFSIAGFEKPKPFIDVNGKPMISRVLDNIGIKNAKFFLIAQKSHLEKESIIVNEIEKKYDANFIPIDGLTEGTACTVLHARKHINNDSPLIIANSDQIVDIDLSKFLMDCQNRKLDGSILCFEDPEKNPKWSFAKINNENLVTEVQEKNPISKFATVGIYLFSKGKYFINSSIDMIINNERVNNEFYTCPVYNYLINENKRIGIYNIKYNQMHGLGTPEDLNNYLNYKKWKN